MFAKACKEVRRSVYGYMGKSRVGPKGASISNGTAFMISPGVIATAAHAVHVESNPKKPVHQVFELICATDVGSKMEVASLIAEDQLRDIALLRIDDARNDCCVKLVKGTVPAGTPCGSLGFPLASVMVSPKGNLFNLIERFQGAYVSAYSCPTHPSGEKLAVYETDSLMYSGSSGCPGFLKDGRVFGMNSRSAVEKANTGEAAKGAGARLAISIWVAATDIAAFARKHGI